MFAPDLIARADVILAACRTRKLTIATAESCTGGLVASVLTEIAGASDVFTHGFVTYSNDAKTEMLGVPPAVIERHGAVSAAVALAMVEGALKAGRADVGVAITGIAGPGGGSANKPVGLVYIAAHRKGQTANMQRFTFGDIGRTAIRTASVHAALEMLLDAVKSPTG